ncbi:transglycosylase SLT domain-containing protein [Quadrisphaera sp. INWT6]|uniref:transglycosylase SLT domain-containing protein n=1 Tax=Quadrisphaera sp. INWT6 TaxID=2596917 RepID=UPI00189240C8|nr:transglycosylase SLT domain-containing protein [Quadrisphaera sp. INWT6]MBF5083124.1 transglycosylase SLT domain-containing protein [Quadrisphaera sp. INWT6]
MSSPALQAASASLSVVQDRVIFLQQRIAALTGAPVSASGSTSNSATFASTLAMARTQLDGSGTATSGASGDDLVTDAKKYLGVPYVWGGTDPDTGLDCSGFTQLVAKENGITLPRTAAQQAKVGTEVPSLDKAKAGDLVVLEGGSHIGIYVGDGKMIHAPKAGDVVKISKVWETPMTIRRLTTDDGSSALSGSSSALLASMRASVLGSSAGSSATTAVAGTSRASGASGASAFQGLFDAAEAKYGLPDGLLSAVAKTESSYDPDAVSPAGARGLMQIMPGTARELGVDPSDPAQAVDGAARLLSKHLDRFGSLPLALAAYNAGPGNVSKYGGVPPFTETQNYVRRVSAAMS